MKKALVLLLILAVAGGIFAQDLALSIGGETRFGTDIDFMPPDAKATMKPEDAHFDGFDNYGLVNLNLDKPGAHFNLQFKGEFTGAAEQSGMFANGTFGDGVNGEENFFKFNANVGYFDGTKVDSLYGYWLFIDRQLKVDLAYKGYETIYWRVSDVVASDWDNLDGMGGLAISFMPNALAGLNVGVFFPGNDSNAIDGRDGAFVSANGGLFLNDWFKEIVIGAKYQNDMFGVSAMFNAGAERNLGSTGINFGFKFTGIANLSVGVDAEIWDMQFAGDDNGDDLKLSFGANVEYAAAPLTAGVSFGVTDYTTNENNDKVVFHIKPYVYYDIIADTLQARLIPELMIGVADNDKYKVADIEADLFWNMNRDGTGDDPAMGLLVKYVMGLDLDGDGTTRSTTPGFGNVTEGGLYKSELGLYFRWAF